MTDEEDVKLVALETDQPIWSRFFTVAPLVVVGSLEATGEFDLAPKHMATPLSWENYFGFVCTPSHRTYQNVKREEAFTVSYPNPNNVFLTSLAAAPRCDDNSKPMLQVMPTIPAVEIEGVLLKDSYLFLECKLDRIIDGFGANSLIAGKVISARVDQAALRLADRDDQDLLAASPLLAYLPPARYASIEQSLSFPFPEGLKKGDQE
ncbi:MAG: flavin reductase [Mariniblastus sp.]|nr:flavin reductase [Mariniblastus sp.]